MTRQEQLNAIGKLQPSVFDNGKEKSLNYMSYFIIPLPHRVYDTKNSKKFFKAIKSSGWTIKNPKSKNTRPLDSNDTVKRYIYEHLLSTIKDEEKDIIYENKNLLLHTKLKSSKKKLRCADGKILDILLGEIDLWILDEFIAFFVLRVELPADSNLDIATISSKLNRSFRDFRNISTDGDTFFYANEKYKSDTKLIEWLMSLTIDDDKMSFLNIKIEDFTNDEFYPIYNSSYYAKMITAIHVDSDTVKNGERDFEIEPAFEKDLLFDNINGTSTLEEMPYYLASTSDIYPDRDYEANEEYIHSLVNKGGINLWKYWSGIALDDSLAFFSLKSGRSGIVYASRNENYFIYMLNLYINYKLRYFEHNLIDKNFTNLDKIYPKFVELQQLRNELMTDEIAIKFQQNEIHVSISKALRTEKIFSEVKENIIDTLALTKNNTDMIITIGGAFVTFLGVWISQDKLLAFYDSYPFATIASLFVLGFFMVMIVVKRSKVIKFFKSNFKKLKNNFRLSM